MGTGCEEVSRTATPDSDDIVGRWKGGRIGTVRANRPHGAQGAVVFRGNKAVQSDSTMKEGYGPLLQQIVKFFQTGTAPVAPEALSEADRAIALLGAEELADLVSRAGAIFWANAIANVVLAADVRWLHEQLGEELCALALANRNLAGPAPPLEPLDGVEARIREDGERCLAAWCRAQPAAVGVRVRLKRAPSAALDDAPQAPFAEIGAPIVRCAA